MNTVLLKNLCENLCTIFLGQAHCYKFVCDANNDGEIDVRCTPSENIKTEMITKSLTDNKYKIFSYLILLNFQKLNITLYYFLFIIE